jgi:hypothetical protein
MHWALLMPKPNGTYMRCEEAELHMQFLQAEQTSRWSNRN